MLYKCCYDQDDKQNELKNDKNEFNEYWFKFINFSIDLL